MKEENFFRCFCSGRLNFTSILFVHVAFAVAISAVVAGCATAATAVAVATCNWQHTCKRAGATCKRQTICHFLPFEWESEAMINALNYDEDLCLTLSQCGR